MKKGFTLIELLAVIVILAVIALIATASILSIISRAEKGALEDSAYGIIEAGNAFYINHVLSEASNESYERINFEILKGKFVNVKNKDEALEFKGSMPKTGKLQINANGDTAIAICNNKYCACKSITETRVTVQRENCEIDEETGEILNGQGMKGCLYDSGQVFSYEYTGSSQTFRVSCDGNYLIELYGASGGGTYGGHGAYTSGNIFLKKNTSLIVEVGGEGSILTGGYNGGGDTGATTVNLDSIEVFGGGGATDIRLDESTISRIMIAAGGGGQSRDYGENSSYGCYFGGAGGTLNGLDGCSIKGSKGDLSTGGKGATQLKGGSPGTGSSGIEATGGMFGQGGIGGGTNASYVNKTNYVGSGGGGGGGRGGFGGVTGDGGHMGGAGGGGSSFISGYSGCNAVSNLSTGKNIIHSGNSNHYSEYIFISAKMIDGNSPMPAFNSLSTMIGNKGNGYAKITYLGNG